MDFGFVVRFLMYPIKDAFDTSDLLKIDGEIKKGMFADFCAFLILFAYGYIFHVVFELLNGMGLYNGVVQESGLECVKVTLLLFFYFLAIGRAALSAIVYDDRRYLIPIVYGLLAMGAGHIFDLHSALITLLVVGSAVCSYVMKWNVSYGLFVVGGSLLLNTILVVFNFDIGFWDKVFSIHHFPTLQANIGSWWSLLVVALVLGFSLLLKNKNNNIVENLNADEVEGTVSEGDQPQPQQEPTKKKEQKESKKPKRRQKAFFQKVSSSGFGGGNFKKSLKRKIRNWVMK